MKSLRNVIFQRNVTNTLAENLIYSTAIMLRTRLLFFCVCALAVVYGKLRSFFRKTNRKAQPTLTGYDRFVNYTSSISDSSGNPLYFAFYYNVDNTSLSVGVVCETRSLTDWCAWGIEIDIVCF